MIICHCMGVTDADVLEEFAQGLQSLRELAARLGVGTDCGRCMVNLHRAVQRFSGPGEANTAPIAGDADLTGLTLTSASVAADVFSGEGSDLFHAA